MKKLLTVCEVAQKLRCSDWSVRAYVRLRRLPAIRLHPRGRMLFDPEQLEQALQRQEPAAAAAA